MPAKHHRIRALAAAVLVAIAATGVASAPASTSAVSVQVKAEHLTGLRPDGSTVLIQLRAIVEGADASSLEGAGKHFGSGGAHAEWAWSGSVDGDRVTLTGLVTDSNSPFVLGVPGELSANASTGLVTLTFGPLVSGPYEGKSITVEGPGRVIVKRSDS